MRSKGLFAFVLVMAFAFALAGQGFGAIIRVKWDSPTDGTGGDWDHAYHTVAAGIAASVSGNEVWVARGTYAERITLKIGVALYGGFAGDETSRDQRDFSTNVTILDGNQGGSVVTSPSGATSSTRIDGFTIRNGMASRGAGINCSSSSPTICNSIVSQNFANSYGAGIYCSSSSPVICNNTVSRNSAGSYGAGIYCISSSAVVANNVIAGNCASCGGGVCCDNSSTASICNNTIVANSATSGGGLYSLSGSPPTISNNIVAFNSSGFYKSSGGSPVLKNNCFYNPDGYNYSGMSPGTGDIQVDPRLAGVEYGEIHIQADSPCVDAGYDAAVQSGWLDIDGQARIQGAHVDMGADEYDGVAKTFTPTIVRVSPTGNDANDGSTWALAKRTVQSGIDAAGVHGGKVWVAAGVYNECVVLGAYTYLYGGFTGTESSQAQRDWRANTTTLDGGAAGSVVTIQGAGYRVCWLDGFTIRNGKSTYGAGIWCVYSAPIIENNTITGNVGYSQRGTTTLGGGIYCYNSSPAISNNKITGNSAGNGGAIYCYHSSSTVSGNTIAANSAGNYGGGICVDLVSPTTISNNIITSNSAGSGGGIYCNYSSTISNNTITANGASSGGGIYCMSTMIAVTNNTIAANAHDGIYCYPLASVTIANNILAFSSYGVYGTPAQYTLCNNCVYNPDGQNYFGTAAGTGDIQLDPKLVAVDYGQVHIQASSPCRNAGYDAAVQTGWLDIDSQPRIQGSHVDIGADESDGTTWSYTPVVIRVSATGSDANDGSSWALAKRTVQAGILAMCAGGGEVWVAAGTYNERAALTAYTYLYGGFSATESSKTQRDWNANATIVDGGGTGYAVQSYNGRSTAISGVDGFTIRNGSGAGIACWSSSTTISNNTIATNTSAGVYCFKSAALVVGNRITGNAGTGVLCYGGAPVICGNTISANNGGSSSGGLYSYGSSAVVSDNIIAFNSSGVLSNGNGGIPALRNNCVYNLAGYNYSGLSAGVGDVSVDPMFVNRAGGDYHIKASSPCVNAGWDGATGIPTLDMDGEARLNGTVDIGADEYWLGPIRCVSEAKAAIDTSLVSIYGGIVSAKFADCFYIESDDRVSGMMVKNAGHTLNAGDRARVLGALATNVDSERYIEATTADSTGTGSVGPLAMPNRSIGGGTFGLQSGVWGWLYTKDQSGQPVRLWDKAFGLNNIGLLISTCGRVTGIEHTDPPALPTWFTIDDGSDLNLKCIVPSGVTIEPGWQYLRVTGVASCEKVGSELHAVVKVRSRADITAL